MQSEYSIPRSTINGIGYIRRPRTSYMGERYLIYLLYDQEQMEILMDQIESNMELVGVSAIEDSL